MTNREWLAGLSDKQLAKWICNLTSCPCCPFNKCGWGCDVSNWLSRRFNGFGSGGDYRRWRAKDGE